MRPRSSVLLFLSLSVLGAVASPASAGDQNELTFGSWTRALRSDSANAITDDNLTGGALSYARALRIRPMPELDVWATGSFTWAGVEGTMFRTLATSASVIGFSAGGRARLRLHDRVAVGGRLDLGTARTSLELEDLMGHRAADARWGGIATAAVGLDLLAIAGPRFALGIRTELGYTVAPPRSLTASPDGDEDDDVIKLPAREAELGGLDLGGRFFGFSIVSQF